MNWIKAIVATAAIAAVVAAAATVIAVTAHYVYGDSLTGSLPRTPSKDYGRRPDIADDYTTMMKTATDRAVWNQATGSHSELKKPYLFDEYVAMETIHEPLVTMPYAGAANEKLPNPSPPETNIQVVRDSFQGASISVLLPESVNIGESATGTAEVVGASWKDSWSWSGKVDHSSVGIKIASGKTPKSTITVSPTDSPPGGVGVRRVDVTAVGEVSKLKLTGSGTITVATAGGVNAWSQTAHHSSIAVSSNGLTITRLAAGSGTWALGRSETPIPPGKTYMEYTLHSTGAEYRHYLGVGTKNSVPDFWAVAGNIGWSWYNQGPTAWDHGVWKLFGQAQASPVTLRMAVDTGAKKIWMGGSFRWMNSTGWDLTLTPATGCEPMYSNLSGELYVWYAMYATDAAATANFGASSWVYTIPAGFIGMNGGG